MMKFLKIAEYKSRLQPSKKREYEDVPVELSLALMNGDVDPFLDIESPDISMLVVHKEQALESDQKVFGFLEMSNNFL